MEKIFNKYDELFRTPSDINEHLPILRYYADECKHITELGVRWAVSTYAFLITKPEKLISYDIKKDNAIDEAIKLAKEYNINFVFKESDVLNIEIEETDILFIDTLHTYNQLTQELNLHSGKSKKYIILHDTTSYGYIDEHIYEHSSKLLAEKIDVKQGIKNALNDFLVNDKGKKWIIHREYTNNNGLTILKRNNDIK